ncbi:ATP-binding protein [Sphingomonas sp. AP4-R1]|uniref:ATP-binding protein n=1 Tax=Sphingomonas sp. AP4-R1 TaxID=2735134 RepID=UPI001C10E9EE|nr:ATP-binding protein [Sphingomonas sp. AP4-R1]
MNDAPSHAVTSHEQTYWRREAPVIETLAELTEAPADSEFRLLADNLPALCWMARADGYIVWYNRRWHEYCGTTPQDMEGWGWQAVHDPDQVEAVTNRWQACIRVGEPFEMVFPLRGRDGQLRSFLTRISPLRDGSGEIARWYGVNTEVSAQFQEEARRDAVEAALYAAKLERDFIINLTARQRSLHDPLAIMHLSAEHIARRLGINRACFYRLLENERVRYVGCWSDAGLPNLSGESASGHLGERLEKARRTGQLTSFGDSRHDPLEGLVELSGSGILAAVDVPISRAGSVIGGFYIAHGEVRLWTENELALVREVAELTWLAVERAEAIIRLEDRVARQDGDLARAASDLRSATTGQSDAESQVRQLQKMEAVGQLTGGIAHDFNNMLAVIIGGLNLAQRRLDRGDTDIKRFMDGAMEGATRAAALTQRLLAFSRQQPLAPETVDGNKLVNGLTELLSRTLGERVQLETVLTPGLWKTLADPIQLENVIVNLAVNARDAMPDGGKLTIETGNANIDAEYAHDAEIPIGHYVMLAVSDTGSGMPAAVIAKAFDPFFTTKGVGKGTGLGLSQVFGFVRQSGGHVRIYSEVGHGTTIKIYLPRTFAEQPQAIPRRSAAMARGGNSSEIILVVEDEERVRNFSTEALRELGYTVIHADGGHAALAIIDGGQDVTLLFTDIVMPEMTGRQLADEAVKRLPRLRVVYTTGYTRNAVVHNGVIDPGTNFLPKPFGMDQLASKIREALDD